MTTTPSPAKQEEYFASFTQGLSKDDLAKPVGDISVCYFDMYHIIYDDFFILFCLIDYSTTYPPSPSQIFVLCYCILTILY